MAQALQVTFHGISRSEAVEQAVQKELNDLSKFGPLPRHHHSRRPSDDGRLHCACHNCCLRQRLGGLPHQQ